MIWFLVVPLLYLLIGYVIALLAWKEWPIEERPVLAQEKPTLIFTLAILLWPVAFFVSDNKEKK